MKGNNDDNNKKPNRYIYRAKNYKRPDDEALSEEIQEAWTKYQEYYRAYKKAEEDIAATKKLIEDLDESINELTKQRMRIINPRDGEKRGNLEEDNVKHGSGSAVSEALARKLEAKEKLNELEESISHNNPESLYFKLYNAQRNFDVLELRVANASRSVQSGRSNSVQLEQPEIIDYSLNNQNQQHHIDALRSRIGAFHFRGNPEQKRAEMATDNTTRHMEKKGLKPLPDVNRTFLLDDEEKDNTKDDSRVIDASSNQKRLDLKRHSKIKNLHTLVRFFPDKMTQESREDALWEVHDILISNNSEEDKRSAVNTLVISLKDNKFMRDSANKILSQHINHTHGNSGYNR